MFLNILVAVDGSEPSQLALARAIELARAGNAKLTLIAVAPPAAAYVALAGLSAEQLNDELERWAKRVLDEARATVPEDVIAHTVQRSGHPGPEICKEIEREPYDLVVLGSRHRRHSQEALGSVNLYVHYHAQVALLSIPGDA